MTQASDLREAGVRIGVSLSWERAFSEVVAGVKKRFKNLLDRKGRVIVIVGLAGAVIVEGERRATLIFHRSEQEGDLDRGVSGRIAGSMSCLIAGLCTRWLECSQKKIAVDWIDATLTALAMRRELHKRGFSPSHTDVPLLQLPLKAIRDIYYSRPFPEKADTEMALIDQGNEVRQRVEFDDLKLRRECESASLSDEKSAENYEILSKEYIGEEMIKQVAIRIAQEGPKALENVPVESINQGKWSSADRKEIEGVRSVRNVMTAYISKWKSQKTSTDGNKQRPDKPLSIGVFGKPGSGKSHVIKMIAEEVGRQLGVETDFLNFNLSQYDSADDLAKAFQKIRDVGM